MQTELSRFIEHCRKGIQTGDDYRGSVPGRYFFSGILQTTLRVICTIRTLNSEMILLSVLVTNTSHSWFMCTTHECYLHNLEGTDIYDDVKHFMNTKGETMNTKNKHCIPVFDIIYNNASTEIINPSNIIVSNSNYNTYCFIRFGIPVVSTFNCRSVSVMNSLPNDSPCAELDKYILDQYSHSDYASLRTEDMEFGAMLTGASTEVYHRRMKEVLQPMSTDYGQKRDMSTSFLKILEEYFIIR